MQILLFFGLPGALLRLWVHLHGGEFLNTSVGFFSPPSMINFLVMLISFCLALVVKLGLSEYNLCKQFKMSAEDILMLICFQVNWKLFSVLLCTD